MALARSLGVLFLVVETLAPEETIRARMAHRARDPHEVSDADIGVYLRMRESYEPPSELTDRHVLQAQTQTGEPAEETTARALDKLVAQVVE